MPNLRDFERRLGGLVEGLFSRTFRSGLQPVELAKRLIKEMDAGRTVGVSEVWAPNRFEFTIAPDDAARFEHADTALARELERVARENADERGWDLMGPAEVTFEIDDTLRKGDFDCVATLVEGPEAVEPAASSSTSDRALVVREGGTQRTVPLDKDVVTIGRLTGCDVVLDDKGASRRHAQLRTKDGVTTLTDLGSTNGTRLNGRTVQSGVLTPGDRITIGSTVLEFRSA